MQTEVHGLSITIKCIKFEEVHQLCEWLGVPLVKFTPKSYTSSGSTTYRSYRYAFKVDQPDKRDKPSKESIYLNLGEEIKDDFGHCTYYNSRLTLHGSFFDCSPEFNLNEFMFNVSSIGQFTVTQADIAYFTYPARGMHLKIWLEWFGKNWKQYLTGNLIRGKTPRHEYTADGKFLRVEFGSASSKYNFATFYQRPDGQLRFEIKFRDVIQCNYLIQPFGFVEGIEERRLEALVTQLDVCEKGTAKSRSPIRNKKFKKLLAASPRSVNWTDIAEQMRQKRELSDNTKYNMDLKRVAGFLNNFFRRYEEDKGIDLLIGQLQELVEVPAFTIN